MTAGNWKAIGMTAALAAAFAAGHYQGLEQGWQEGFTSASDQWQKMAANMPHPDQEREEIDPVDAPAELQTVDLHRQGNEWQMHVKTPTCASVQNVQVIWPKKGTHNPIEIECDNME